VQKLDRGAAEWDDSLFHSGKQQRDLEDEQDQMEVPEKIKDKRDDLT
jgi:hypothetical protein